MTYVLGLVCCLLREVLRGAYFRYYLETDTGIRHKANQQGRAEKIWTSGSLADGEQVKAWSVQLYLQTLQVVALCERLSLTEEAQAQSSLFH